MRLIKKVLPLAVTYKGLRTVTAGGSTPAAIIFLGQEGEGFGMVRYVFMSQARAYDCCAPDLQNAFTFAK